MAMYTDINVTEEDLMQESKLKNGYSFTVITDWEG